MQYFTNILTTENAIFQQPKTQQLNYRNIDILTTENRKLQ